MFSMHITDNLNSTDELQRERYTELIKRLRELRNDPCQYESATSAVYIFPGVVVVICLIGFIIAVAR